MYAPPDTSPSLAMPSPVVERQPHTYGHDTSQYARTAIFGFTLGAIIGVLMFKAVYELGWWWLRNRRVQRQRQGREQHLIPVYIPHTFRWAGERTGNARMLALIW
ncbi:hypothetical protein F5Y19DRAFT_472442 [Xylariaceae sp. FL1651]|nr:hypothetical protein F5Y19DRAFT_472442 [Xylariaceae sp. FL1651]